MEGDNSLLVSVALLERTEPMLNSDKRDQLKKTNLSLIKQNISLATDKISSAGINNIFILGRLVGIVECIDTLTEDDSFVETDTETKNIIITKFSDALDTLYLEVGKYYMTHDFVYSSNLKTILSHIVDKCLQQGFYFGF